MRKSRLFLLAIAAAALFGCGSSDYGGDVQMTPAQSAARLEDEIKKIEANDKMPPQAKERAIAALRASQAMGKGMAADPKNK